MLEWGVYFLSVCLSHVVPTVQVWPMLVIGHNGTANLHSRAPVEDTDLGEQN